MVSLAFAEVGLFIHFLFLSILGDQIGFVLMPSFFWMCNGLRIGLCIPAVWPFSRSLLENLIFQHIPPSQSWARWAAWLDGRCGRCPARSLRGWIQIHFCTASSHGWTMSGRSCAFESKSSHHHLSPCHRRPGSIYQNVTGCKEDK